MSASQGLPQSAAQTRHWRIASALGAAGAVSVLLLLPYLLAMMPQLKARIPIPMPLFALLQALQSGVVIMLLAWAGLALGWRHALDAPWLRRWLHAGSSQPRTARWGTAIALGVAAGAACVALDAGFAWLVSAGKPSTVSPYWWQGLLASFYGGIGEETLCRLFLVSMLVWIGAKLSRNTAPDAGIYWATIIIAALLFGAAHLPAAVKMGMMVTPLQIVRIVALNALVGIVCGWLFWRYGLEHAMLAHFNADLVLHVAAPLL